MTKNSLKMAEVDRVYYVPCMLLSLPCTNLTKMLLFLEIIAKPKQVILVEWLALG